VNFVILFHLFLTFLFYKKYFETQFLKNKNRKTFLKMIISADEVGDQLLFPIEFEGGGGDGIVTPSPYL
jgi:hypothetical protein